MWIWLEWFHVLLDRSSGDLSAFISCLEGVHPSVLEMLFDPVVCLLSNDIHDYGINMRFNLLLGVDLWNIHLRFLGVNWSQEVCPAVG